MMRVSCPITPSHAKRTSYICIIIARISRHIDQYVSMGGVAELSVAEHHHHHTIIIIIIYTKRPIVAHTQYIA